MAPRGAARSRVTPGGIPAPAGIPEMNPGMDFGPGWNSSLDFKPLSLNTGTSRNSSLPDMMSMMSQRDEQNTIDRLALEASRTTTAIPRRSRKRELNQKHN